jgi:hypothetical protein
LSTLKIDPDSPIKNRPNHLFPAFTIDEHLGPPEIAYYSSLYQILMLISANSSGVIQVNMWISFWGAGHISATLRAKIFWTEPLPIKTNDISERLRLLIISFF